MEKSKTTKREVFTKTGFILALVLCATPYVSAPIALVGGFLFTLFFGHPYAKLNHKATNILLKASVVGLGFGMNVQSALQVGREGLGLTVASITTVLILGYLVGGWLKMPRKSSHLVASGTAICGGSAIAAVAPAVNASEKEISVSLGVVFLLIAVVLVGFPFIGHLLGLSQHQFGLWSAIAIHDTSSVVGAAKTYSNEALAIATTTKLIRALWIIPISLIAAFFYNKGTNTKSKISIPYFIFFYIVAMIIATYTPQWGHFYTQIVGFAKVGMLFTLFLIGAGLSKDTIKQVGFKPILLGIILWICISTLSASVIMLL